MTREEQIKEAMFLPAFVHSNDGPYRESYEDGFLAGAKWADDNLMTPSTAAKIRKQIIVDLETKLAIALKALKEIQNSDHEWNCNQCSEDIAEWAVDEIVGVKK